jgi:hypothetical protein
VKRAIILALLAIAGASGETSEAQYWRAMDEDFVATWNKFADAGNALMRDRNVRWDVKKARELPRLFDRVYNHPLYRK